MLDFEPASNNLNSRADLPSDAKAAIYAVEPAGPGRRGPRATAAQTSSRRTERPYGTDYWRPRWRRHWQCGAGRRPRQQRQTPAELHAGSHRPLDEGPGGCLLLGNTEKSRG